MLSCRKTTVHKRNIHSHASWYCVEKQTGGPISWDRLLPCVAAETPSGISCARRLLPLNGPMWFRLSRTDTIRAAHMPPTAPLPPDPGLGSSSSRRRRRLTASTELAALGGRQRRRAAALMRRAIIRRNQLASRTPWNAASPRIANHAASVEYVFPTDLGPHPLSRLKQRIGI